MSNKDKHGTSDQPKTSGSCLRPGIQESDTGDSGEESEPTYRHYDNFETDVCLTQDKDDDSEPLGSISPVIRHAGLVNQPQQGAVTVTCKAPDNKLGLTRDQGGLTHVPRDNFLGVVNNLNRGLSSDSDTESELRPGDLDQTTDDTTTATNTTTNTSSAQKNSDVLLRLQ